MTLPASIRVNVRANFPAQVNAGALTTIAKANGVWTIGASYKGLASPPSVTATTVFAVQDTISGVFYKLALSDLLSAIASSLPTVLPAASGVMWNNGGVVSIS